MHAIRGQRSDKLRTGDLLLYRRLLAYALGRHPLTILASGVLPPSASRDAAHIAVAAFHAVDYLLTWNCKHLANAQITRKIESVCRGSGYRMPIICTSEELMGA